MRVGAFAERIQTQKKIAAVHMIVSFTKMLAFNQQKDFESN